MNDGYYQEERAAPVKNMNLCCIGDRSDGATGWISYESHIIRCVCGKISSAENKQGSGEILYREFDGFRSF